MTDIEFPFVRCGDIVCIITNHNETQDDFHFGLVSLVPEKYKEDGKIEVIFMLNRWIESRKTFDYEPKFAGWDTWRLTKECIEINKHRCMFTHSCGFPKKE